MRTDPITIDGHQFYLSTDHSASSYHQPVVVCPDGDALGQADLFWTGRRYLSGGEIYYRIKHPAPPREGPPCPPAAA